MFRGKTDLVSLRCSHLLITDVIKGRVDVLTYVSEVDEAVLADVGAGAGLRRDNGAGVALLIADDAKLRRLDATWQVNVEHSAQLLQ